MLRRWTLSVAALSAASLLLESTLTRLLAVAQFYHFAFLAVSLALLGFGASGTLLTLAPRLAQAERLERLLAIAGACFAGSTALAYAVVNLLPFDSYSIAWDRKQLLYFGLYYLALTLPFLCGGLGIGAALAASGGRSHLVYAANLFGSAAGVLLAPAMLWLAGVPGAVLASALIGLLAVAISLSSAWHFRKCQAPRPDRSQPRPACGLRPRQQAGRTRPGIPDRGRSRGGLAAVALLAGLIGLGLLAGLNLSDRAGLGMAISPYKGLAHARRFPGATALFGRWDAVARVDVVANAGTHLLPGLSYTYPGLPPPQYGLSLDADSLQPITLVRPEEFAAAAFLPEAVAFELRPGGRVLVLEPGGGLGVLQALAEGRQVGTGDGAAGRVVAVTDNSLARQAIADVASEADPYAHPRVRTVLETGRIFLRHDRSFYDVVFVPLTDPYRPVTSGAYSLAESYSLTVEAFADALARLAPGGVLVVTRWLQTPPSEEVRLVATLVEALTRRGVVRSADALVAYRGIQTLTVLVQPDGWRSDELATVRAFAETRRYDLVWAPDVRSEEVNRFNRLPVPEQFEAVRDLLAAPDRAAFYAAYPFAIVPATDDRPFFFHFFRWGQTPQVLATLGRTWQPFGGSGYFVLFALLALVFFLSGLLIAAPLVIVRSRTVAHDPRDASASKIPVRGKPPCGTANESLTPLPPFAQHPFGAPGLEVRSPGEGGVKGVITPPSRSTPLGLLTAALCRQERGLGGEAIFRTALLYFGLLGIAFLFVEIPLIQRSILLFGHPTYAFTAVVLPLLLCSGLGSTVARAAWLPRRAAFGALVVLALLAALAGPRLTTAALGWSLAARGLAAVVSLAPLALLMGLPFPLGLAWLEAQAPHLVPWAWAVNGCASVIAAVLAAILALSIGFTAVLLLGAGAYAVAGLLISARRSAARR